MLYVLHICILYTWDYILEKSWSCSPSNSFLLVRKAEHGEGVLKGLRLKDWKWDVASMSLFCNSTGLSGIAINKLIKLKALW